MTLDASAAEILARASHAYATCRSYRDEGEQTTVFLRREKPRERDTSKKRFRTAFVRPDRFFFEYRDVLGPEPKWHRGVIWTAADGVHTWNTFGFPDRDVESLAHAVGAFAGVSSMTSYFAASLLLPEINQRSALPDPATARVVGETKVGRAACLVVEGVRFENRKVRVWIDRASHLVRRLDSGNEFNEETHREQMRQLREAAVKLAPDDPKRALLEKGLAMRSGRPAQNFRTESTIIWRPTVDVQIDPIVFDFEPPMQ